MFPRFNFLKSLKTIHGWLGALILPWVFLAGLTGLYLNNEKLVLSVFPKNTAGDGAQFLDIAGAAPVDLEAATLIANKAVAGMAYTPNNTTRYRGASIYRFRAGSNNTIYIDRDTGGYWHLRRYKISSFDKDGNRLGTEYRWGRILSSIHERGFVGNALGRWLADITAVALMVFSASGIVLFVSPRIRRAKNRRARSAATRT
jgi:hypothetical protein